MVGVGVVVGVVVGVEVVVEVGVVVVVGVEVEVGVVVGVEVVVEVGVVVGVEVVVEVVNYEEKAKKLNKLVLCSSFSEAVSLIESALKEAYEAGLKEGKTLCVSKSDWAQIRELIEEGAEQARCDDVNGHAGDMCKQALAIMDKIEKGK